MNEEDRQKMVVESTKNMMEQIQQKEDYLEMLNERFLGPKGETGGE